MSACSACSGFAWYFAHGWPNYPKRRCSTCDGTDEAKAEALADMRADRDDWMDRAEAFREGLVRRGGEEAVAAALEAFYCRPDVAARYFGEERGREPGLPEGLAQ